MWLFTIYSEFDCLLVTKKKKKKEKRKAYNGVGVPPKTPWVERLAGWMTILPAQ